MTKQKSGAQLPAGRRARKITQGYDMSTRKARRRVWNFYWQDHAWVRVLWTNMAEIAPGVWRSNHPSPRRLQRYKQMGIRTVLSLRGTARRSHNLFEQQACQELGLTLLTVPMKARRLAPRGRLLTLLDMFETIEKPFVMHCKSGADRAGLASALYLLHIQGATVEEAKKQLSLRYVHIRRFKTGILDDFLDAYEADTRARPMPIREWIRTRYDRDRLTADFHEKRGIPA